jgi:hypothetical protein
MSFFKNEGKEGKAGPVLGLVPVEEGEHKKCVEGEYGGDIIYSCMKMEQ